MLITISEVWNNDPAQNRIIGMIADTSDNPHGAVLSWISRNRPDLWEADLDMNAHGFHARITAQGDAVQEDHSS